MTNRDFLKSEILRLTAEYSRSIHKNFRPGYDPNRKEWINGDNIPYAGRVFDEKEVVAAVSTTLDFWLTLGTEGNNLQQEFSDFLGVKNTLYPEIASKINCK